MDIKFKKDLINYFCFKISIILFTIVVDSSVVWARMTRRMAVTFLNYLFYFTFFLEFVIYCFKRNR